jgi:hypothetical protein
MGCAHVHRGERARVPGRDRQVARLSDCTRCETLQRQLREARDSRVVAAIWSSRETEAPRPFGLYRHQDVTGASGVGLVATGVQFVDGVVVIRWRGESPSTVIWPSIEAAEKIHGHGGKTQIVWLTEPIEELCAAIEEDQRKAGSE